MYGLNNQYITGGYILWQLSIKIGFPTESTTAQPSKHTFPKNIDYSTIAGHFVPIVQASGSPAVSTSASGTPVAVVLDKVDDFYDPYLDGFRKNFTGYMVRLQISGIAAVNYSGSIPVVGSYAQLGPDGNGGVKTVDSGGRSYLVVGSNTITKQIWIVL